MIAVKGKRMPVRNLQQLRRYTIFFVGVLILTIVMSAVRTYWDYINLVNRQRIVPFAKKTVYVPVLVQNFRIEPRCFTIILRK